MARRKPPKAPASWTDSVQFGKKSRSPRTYSVVSKAESRNVKPIEGKIGNLSKLKKPSKKAPGANMGTKKAKGAPKAPASWSGGGGGRQRRDQRGRFA